MEGTGMGGMEWDGHHDDRHQDGGHQDDGHQDDGHQDGGHQDDGHQDDGHQDDGHQDGGHPNEGHQDDGHQDDGHQDDGHQDGGHQDDGHQDDGHQDGGHPNEGHQDDGHQDGGHPNEGHQDDGHQDGGHQDDGHQDDGHQDDGHQDGGHQDNDQYPHTADVETLFLQRVVECRLTQHSKEVEDLIVLFEEKCEWTLEEQKMIRAEERCQCEFQQLQGLLEQKQAALKDKISTISDLEQKVRVLAEENKSCKNANENLGSCLRREKEKVTNLQFIAYKSDVLCLQGEIRHLTKTKDEVAEANQELISSIKSCQEKNKVLQDIIQQRTDIKHQVHEMSCKFESLQDTIILPSTITGTQVHEMSFKFESQQEHLQQEKVKLEARCLRLETIMADKNAMKKEIKRIEEEDKKKKKQEAEERKKREKEEKRKKKQEEEERKKREKEEKRKKKQEEEERK
ncbi:uncharacterized protein V6R79_008287 [Siganus canaliculatus]